MNQFLRLASCIVWICKFRWQFGLSRFEHIAWMLLVKQECGILRMTGQNSGLAWALGYGMPRRANEQLNISLEHNSWVLGRVKILLYHTQWRNVSLFCAQFEKYCSKHNDGGFSLEHASWALAPRNWSSTAFYALLLKRNPYLVRTSYGTRFQHSGLSFGGVFTRNLCMNFTSHYFSTQSLKLAFTFTTSPLLAWWLIFVFFYVIRTTRW